MLSCNQPTLRVFSGSVTARCSYELCCQSSQIPTFTLSHHGVSSGSGVRASVLDSRGFESHLELGVFRVPTECIRNTLYLILIIIIVYSPKLNTYIHNWLIAVKTYYCCLSTLRILKQENKNSGEGSY